MNLKEWRIEKDDFNKISTKWIYSASVNVLKNCSLKKGTAKNPNQATIDRLIRKANATLILPGEKKWKDPNIHPYTKEERSLLINLAAFDKTLWKLSNVKQSEKWIIIALLMNIIYNKNYVSISYLCQSNSLSKEFIKDMVFITSGFFDFSYWNDRSVEFIWNLFKLQKLNKESIVDSTFAIFNNILDHYFLGDVDPILITKTIMASEKLRINIWLKNYEIERVIKSFDRELSKMKVFAEKKEVLLSMVFDKLFSAKVHFLYRSTLEVKKFSDLVSDKWKKALCEVIVNADSYRNALIDMQNILSMKLNMIDKEKTEIQEYISDLKHHTSKSTILIRDAIDWKGIIRGRGGDIRGNNQKNFLFD